ncbi:DegT/DnrJ/EryC1/StrS family aminotransferase [Pelagicoccus sp. SDUM812003]|uniref:DegT/DnrJ/EryC1/StrS family aminotransferase n=1 Tax=Pelagicoccus sp. SDUM812003 TaxID=3041267 RepID=UPI00280E5D81|nr:DegT/DnrJ/EryC1/StrS family aminotransferase [Pelagicoccus sp. SDUM812003]MDQ8202864.1 DegT/DnrJ/EryC1/StrS family aminotransferase [Pelagicoccus sp. SDUM812003]
MKVPFIDLQRAHAPLKEELIEAFSRTIDHGGYCLGPDVDAFEAGFAEEQHVAGCVGVGSGTEALHLIALAMGVGPGDEVVVPAFTFIASAWFAQYVGAKVVFADVDSNTFTVTRGSIEKVVTDKTKAIVVTHLFGQAADMEPIMAFAMERGIKVVEDAAQAHLAQYKGRYVGDIGDAAAFSFYPTKNLGGLGEGGAVTSRDSALLEQIRILRAHGSKERYLNHFVGYNNRMEGLQAAALNVKLPHLRGKTARRQRIARGYLGGISNKDIQLPMPTRYGESVYHMFTIRHPERDRLKAYLAEQGIGSDIVYPYPLHLQPCFSFLGYREGDFPVAEEVAKTCLSLPIVPELTDEEIDYVIKALNAFA